MGNITALQKTLIKYMENNPKYVYRMQALHNWSTSYMDKDNNPVNEDWKYLIEMGKFEIELVNFSILFCVFLNIRSVEFDKFHLVFAV